MTTSRQNLGRWGESLASQFLARHGYTILDCNARTPYGELDLVARQRAIGPPGEREPGWITVFVEVKTRSSRTFGLPEESVTARKQAHLLAAAQYYLQQHPELQGDWRIDVVAVQRYRRDQPAAIHHFENAVTGAG
jgi:putative endonuclease